MTKSQKLTLLVIAAVVVLIAVAATLVARVDVKTRFEAFASEATGMQVTVGGHARVWIVPTLQLTLADVHVRNRSAEIASIDEAHVTVALLPLLYRQVRVRGIALQGLTLSVEKDRNGKLNLDRATAAKRESPAMALPGISLAKASFRYSNQQTNREFLATDCDLSNGRAALSGGGSDLMKGLSLRAKIKCARMQNNEFAGTGVQFTVAGEQGVLEAKPLTMDLLGGKGVGNVHADFKGSEPVYRVHYAVTKLHMDQLLKSLSATQGGEGLLDFSTDLSMRGFDAAELTRTAQGEAVLRGSDLTLAMGNLDEKFSRYESTQSFNLIDVGAFFLAGPLGTAVTKGYGFASVLQKTPGTTPVRTFISHWKVEQGVAHAIDVAMATPENRVAMKGGLDFVNKQFDDVIIALLDDKGCSRVQQEIHGSFREPRINPPNVLISLAGPVRRLFRKAESLVGAQCEAFYAGSVVPPK